MGWPGVFSTEKSKKKNQLKTKLQQCNFFLPWKITPVEIELSCWKRVGPVHRLRSRGLLENLSAFAARRPHSRCFSFTRNYPEIFSRRAGRRFSLPKELYRFFPASWKAFLTTLRVMPIFAGELEGVSHYRKGFTGSYFTYFVGILEKAFCCVNQNPGSLHGTGCKNWWSAGRVHVNRRLWA